MADRPFTRGVHDQGNGLYSYVQPDGGWGLSNVGQIAARGQALLVDTLMERDPFKTVPGRNQIDRLFNSHCNPDQVIGNGLVEVAEIIATTRCREETHYFVHEGLAVLRTNYPNMSDPIPSGSSPTSPRSIANGA